MSGFDERPRPGDEWSERQSLPATNPRLPRPGRSPSPDGLIGGHRPAGDTRRNGAHQPDAPRDSGRQTRQPRPSQRPASSLDLDSVTDEIDQWDTVRLPAMQIDQFASEAMPIYRPTGRPRKPPIEHDAQGFPPRITNRPYEQVADLPTWVMPVVQAQSEAQTTAKRPVVAPAAKSYVELVRNLATSSGIYALASLSAPFVSLVLAPFLTHHLTPADYGTLAILNTLISLVAGISQLGLGSAFFRAFGYDFTSASGRKGVIASINALLVLTSLLVLGAAAVWSRDVAAILLGDPQKGDLVFIAAVVILIQNFSVPGLAWMRAASRPGFYSALAVCNLVIGLGANIYLVGYAQMGIRGALIATGCGYASIALIMLPVSIIHSQLRIRLDVAWSMLTFGSPQVMSVVSAWVLSLSDRYLLTVFGSLDQVARYSVAYSLGAVVSTIIISPFQMAWPTAMYAIAKRPDAPQVYKIVFRWFGMVLLLAAFGLAVCCTAVLEWLFPKSYRAAAPIIPVVGLSLAMYGVYIVFMIGASIQRKTWMAAVFSTTAAAINVGVNLILIPRYGAFGAAAATLIAYMALAAMAYIGNQIIYPIPYEIWRFILAMLSGAGLLFLVDVAAKHAGIIGGVAIGAAGFIIYAAWLVFLARGSLRVRIPRNALARKAPGNVAAGRHS